MMSFKAVLIIALCNCYYIGMKTLGRKKFGRLIFCVGVVVFVVSGLLYSYNCNGPGTAGFFGIPTGAVLAIAGSMLTANSLKRRIAWPLMVLVLAVTASFAFFAQGFNSCFVF